MGQILTSSEDYNAVRAALGLDKDSSRLLTDDIINAFQHLPLAEAELFDRNEAGVFMLLARDPFDYQRNALKAACCALTCGFLCRRLQTTVPIRSKIELGEVERYDVDWDKRRQNYINDCNWAWSLTSLSGKGFPTPMDSAAGGLRLHDPLVRSIATGGSDFTGYTSPFSGYLYGFGLTA